MTELSNCGCFVSPSYITLIERNLNMCDFVLMRKILQVFFVDLLICSAIPLVKAADIKLEAEDSVLTGVTI